MDAEAEADGSDALRVAQTDNTDSIIHNPLYPLPLNQSLGLGVSEAGKRVELLGITHQAMGELTPGTDLAVNGLIQSCCRAICQIGRHSQSVFRRN